MPNDSAASWGSMSEACALEGGKHPSLLPHQMKTAGAWSLAIEDRRASPRLEGHLSTVLYCGDRNWRGESKSIGLGGVALAFAENVPAMLNQHVKLSLSPDALDSVGIVRGIRRSGDATPFGEVQPGSILAVQFLQLSPMDELVVSSLLAEGRIRSGGVRIAVALVAEENDDALIDGDLDEPVTIPQPPKRHVGGSEEPGQERRRHRRVPVGSMTEAPFVKGVGDRALLQTVRKDFTSASACLPDQECLTNSKLLVDWGPKTNKQDSGVHSGASVMEELLDQTQSRSQAEAGSSDGPGVISAFLECFRPSGDRIVLCHDRPRSDAADDAPIVVLAPGYGESKRDYVPLAYYLAGNGFHVVRYDNVNHVGESDGVVTQFRLQDMERDLETMLDYVAARWPRRPIGLVATSLAGRVALKVTAGTSHVKLLVLINGIMDVRHTLHAVHQEDLIGEHLAGVHKGVVNILGLTIDADRWLAHALQGQYASLATTTRDAERLRTPVVLFHAEHDAWVDPCSIQTVEAAVGPYLRHSYVVPGALHRLQESPRKARTVYRQIALNCREELWANRPAAEIVDPSHREIGAQNRVERERGKIRRSMRKSDHIAFWKDYLHNFQTIPNVPDFWRLMDHVYRLMGDCHRGERILDAGCGNGNFGVFLQLNQAFRQQYARRDNLRSLDYVGVDFVPTALEQATANFAQVGTTLQEQFHQRLRPYVPMSMQVCRVDLESPLPFCDQSFDRVVCNLVIGYLRDPLFTLREYLRVLKPRGRLVISNLKPYADLSAIYRSFVETAHTLDQIEEGRRLLDNSGRIKEREGEGIFNFLHHTELETLLRAAGASYPGVYSTFGNQALIAVAEKTAASLTVAA